jgi:hypothetical protein
MTSFFRTGSFGNGTSIRGFSDVDYIAEIPRTELTANSTYFLAKMRQVLDARFPGTGVTVRSPAVALPFGPNAAETTEVTPGDFTRTVGGGRYRLYEIPDRYDGWMETVPDAHNAFVAREDQRLGGKVKGLVRLIKAWKYYRGVPILSFYLEMRTAQYASGENSIVFSIDLKRLLGSLLNASLSAMQDPTGYTGLIYPCISESQRADALSKLTTAYIRAEKARDAEENNRVPDAFYWWNLLFDGNFPAYG